MVLRPLDVPTTSASAPVPAWEAVAERQKQQAAAYWLISQPDHANLSGDLAANFISPLFPRVDSLMARAIALHDAGWAMFSAEAVPTEAPALNQQGKPLAFIEFTPEEFLRAWTASIDRAEAVSAAGGIIVSRHFVSLGEFRLNNGVGGVNRGLILGFVDRERARQERLLADCAYSADELDSLLEVLQFCDLLSLYLCSGAEAEVEFPQRLTAGRVRLYHRQPDDFYHLDPSPFQPEEGPLRTISLGVSARYYPNSGAPRLTTLGFLLC